MLEPADYLAIERLYSSYNLAIHRADGNAWAACFTTDGVFSNIARTVTGRVDLAAYAAGFSADRNARYTINSLVIEEAAEGATASCYLTILRLHGLEQTPEIELTGVYNDQLVRRAGEWQFAKRHIERDQ